MEEHRPIKYTEFSFRIKSVKQIEYFYRQMQKCKGTVKLFKRTDLDNKLMELSKTPMQGLLDIKLTERIIVRCSLISDAIFLKYATYDIRS